jgi:hypothetical protein
MKLITPKIVILHCSATPDFKDTDPNLDRFTAADIEVWHVRNGWQKIGYHFVVTRAGLIQPGRWCGSERAEMGAHCLGWNGSSIGVCYIGTKSPTEKQIKSLRALYEQINKVTGFTLENWYTHNHFNTKKSCPGFNMEKMQSILKGD